MSKTDVEICNRVAEDLGIKATDIDLADEDAEKITKRIESARAFLREKGLLWWQDDATPDACEDGFAMMVRAMVCTAFGKQGQGHEAGWEDGRVLIAQVKPSEMVETQAYEFF